MAESNTDSGKRKQDSSTDDQSMAEEQDTAEVQKKRTRVVDSEEAAGMTNLSEEIGLLASAGIMLDAELMKDMALQELRDKIKSLQATLHDLQLENMQLKSSLCQTQCETDSNREELEMAERKEEQVHDDEQYSHCSVLRIAGIPGDSRHEEPAECIRKVCIFLICKFRIRNFNSRSIDVAYRVGMFVEGMDRMVLVKFKNQMTTLQPSLDVDGGSMRQGKRLGKGLALDTYRHVLKKTKATPDLGCLPGTSMSLLVTSVMDDQLFWAQDQGQVENMMKLDELADNLQDDSLHEGPTESVGRCAALYEGEWYRAWIFKEVDEISGRVIVFFVDYGNTEVLPRGHTVKIPQSFWILPPMAKLFCLSGRDLGKLFGLDSSVITAQLIMSPSIEQVNLANSTNTFDQTTSLSEEQTSIGSTAGNSKWRLVEPTTQRGTRDELTSEVETKDGKATELDTRQEPSAALHTADEQFWQDLPNLAQTNEVFSLANFLTLADQVKMFSPGSTAVNNPEQLFTKPEKKKEKMKEKKVLKLGTSDRILDVANFVTLDSHLRVIQSDSTTVGTIEVNSRETLSRDFWDTSGFVLSSERSEQNLHPIRTGMDPGMDSALCSGYETLRSKI